MFFYHELMAMYRHLRTKAGFMEAWPVLLVLASAFLTTMVPLTIYQLKMAFFLGPYSFNFLELIMPVLIAPVFFRERKNKVLLGFAAIFLIIGVVSMPLARGDPMNAIIAAYYTAVPFLYVSCIRFTPFQKDLIKWGALILCLGLVVQVVIFGLGLKTYVSAYSGGELGVSGEVSRVSSTVGAATGTTVYIFIVAVLSSLLFIRCPVFFWGILAVSLVAMVISQSRGATLMMLLFMGGLGLPLLRESRFRGGGFWIRVILLCCGIGSVVGFLYLKPEVVEQWRKRIDYFQGNALDTAGRLYRFEEAYQAFLDSNMLGVGWGNYSPRKKMNPFGHGVVGNSSPHNVYLLLLAEAGILALVLYLLLICKVLSIAWRSGRHMVVVALLLLLIIGHNVEYSYLHVPFLWVYALLLAYACHENVDRVVPAIEFR